MSYVCVIWDKISARAFRRPKKHVPKVRLNTYEDNTFALDGPRLLSKPVNNHMKMRTIHFLKLAFIQSS